MRNVLKRLVKQFYISFHFEGCYTEPARQILNVCVRKMPRKLLITFLSLHLTRSFFQTNTSMNYSGHDQPFMQHSHNNLALKSHINTTLHLTLPDAFSHCIAASRWFDTSCGAYPLHTTPFSATVSEAMQDPHRRSCHAFAGNILRGRTAQRPKRNAEARSKRFALILSPPPLDHEHFGV